MVKRCLETVSLRTLWPFASGMPSSTKQCSARESLNQFKKAGTKVLEYARVLDPDFKPASSPDEEMTRNDKLLGAAGIPAGPCAGGVCPPGGCAEAGREAKTSPTATAKDDGHR